MYRRVLIAADNSGHSRKMAREAFKKASQWGSEVVALFVVDMRYAFCKSRDDFREIFRREGGKAVNFFRQFGDLFDVKVKPLVRRGIPGEVIVDVAKKERVDLIILGPYSKLSRDKDTMGQTAEFAAEKAHCSVLILRT